MAARLVALTSAVPAHTRWSSAASARAATTRSRTALPSPWFPTTKPVSARAPPTSPASAPLPPPPPPDAPRPAGGCEGVEEEAGVAARRARLVAGACGATHSPRAHDSLSVAAHQQASGWGRRRATHANTEKERACAAACAAPPAPASPLAPALASPAVSSRPAGKPCPRGVAASRSSACSSGTGGCCCCCCGGGGSGGAAAAPAAPPLLEWLPLAVAAACEAAAAEGWAEQAGAGAAAAASSRAGGAAASRPAQAASRAACTRASCSTSSRWKTCVSVTGRCAESQLGCWEAAAAAAAAVARRRRQVAVERRTPVSVWCR